MKTIKMALLGGAAIAVTAVSAHAEDLDALKAQIEALNARVAAMETAPSVPAGYSLLTISEGEMKQIPGLWDENARNLRALGPKATVISVLPTADAPAGATITWSGRVNSSLTYQEKDREVNIKFSDPDTAGLVFNFDSPDSAFDTQSNDGHYSINEGDDSDLDILVQSRLAVAASTDTAVGEVGVSMELRANFNGNGTGDAYFNSAWGYWAMTPELTLGGGYSGSLGNIGYGYDGVCQCYQTDFGDAFSLNPGDTTQLRLSYASGPFSMGVALEDGGSQGALGNGDDNSNPNYDQLGAAGEIKYSGDMFSGEISGVWRGVDNDSYTLPASWIEAPELDDTWQIGAGVGFGLGDIAKVSVGAAMGSGPTTSTDEGIIDAAVPLQNDWWGVSGALIFNLTDEFSAELGAAYKHRETEQGLVVETEGVDGTGYWEFNGTDYDIWAVAGGLYYTPVEQLTLGIEGQWQTSESDTSGDLLSSLTGKTATGDSVDLDLQTDTFLVDFTGVWRF